MKRRRLDYASVFFFCLQWSLIFPFFLLWNGSVSSLSKPFNSNTRSKSKFYAYIFPSNLLLMLESALVTAECLHFKHWLPPNLENVAVLFSCYIWNISAFFLSWNIWGCRWMYRLLICATNIYQIEINNPHNPEIESYFEFQSPPSLSCPICSLTSLEKLPSALLGLPSPVVFLLFCFPS